MKYPGFVLALSLFAAPALAEEASVVCPVRSDQEPQFSDLCSSLKNEMSKLKKELDKDRSLHGTLSVQLSNITLINTSIIEACGREAAELFKQKRKEEAQRQLDRAEKLRQEIAAKKAELEGLGYVISYFDLQMRRLKEMKTACDC